jgi:hypothetical protein
VLCWRLGKEIMGDCIVLQIIRVFFAINQLHNLSTVLSPQQRQLLVTNIDRSGR